MTPDNNSTEGNRTGKKTAGSISSEDRDTVIESEVDSKSMEQKGRTLVDS